MQLPFYSFVIAIGMKNYEKEIGICIMPFTNTLR